MAGARAGAAAIAGVAAVAGLLAAAPQASAAGPLRVSVSCESGASRFLCTAAITGGTSPYHTSWQVFSTGHLSQTQGTTLMGICTVPSVAQVTATVIDSTGARASDTTSVVCSSGPWP